MAKKAPEIQERGISKLADINTDENLKLFRRERIKSPIPTVYADGKLVVLPEPSSSLDLRLNMGSRVLSQPDSQEIRYPLADPAREFSDMSDSAPLMVLQSPGQLVNGSSLRLRAEILQALLNNLEHTQQRKMKEEQKV